MFTNPTVSDFKTYFTRDFPYGTDPNEHVLDGDIQKAIDQSYCQINESLFCSQTEYSIGYNLLTAHFLVTNIQASSQGLNGNFEWAFSSKSVGSVSVSQQIPGAISENPAYAWLTRTNYGSQYLMMIYNRIIGNIFTVGGATSA